MAKGNLDWKDSSRVSWYIQEIQQKNIQMYKNSKYIMESFLLKTHSKIVASDSQREEK